MPYFQPEEVSVTCPSCGFRFTVPVFSVIDVEDMPDVVSLLITGDLQIRRCPRCGAIVRVDGPFLFHDGKRQLAYVYVPPNMNMSQEQRQRVIGELTRAVMSRLPKEHPKAYLLQPREFLSLTNMVDAILEALGIDKALLEERRRQGELLNRLLAVMDDPVAFSALVGEHRDKLDANFYALLRMIRDTAADLGRKEDAERIEQLRQKLLPLTQWGRREQAYDRAIAFLREKPSREELLEELITAEDDQVVEAFARVFRPHLDYLFFRLLSQRIEQAEKKDPKEAKRLRALRERLLQLTEEIDKEAKQAMERAERVLRKLMTAEDLDKAIEEHLKEIDDTFLYVLALNIDAAEKQGLWDIAQSLQAIWDAIVRKVRGDVPPELAFLEELLALPREERRAYLEAHRDLVTPELIELLGLLIEDLERRGIKEEAQQLRSIRAQVLAYVSTSKASQGKEEASS